MATAKRNFMLLLEYDGTHFHGWQRQNGVITIQETLESRLEVMLGSTVHVRASGRTDAGVHARGQVVNFNARTRLRPEDFLRGLNGLLPPDIVVLEAREMPPSFHAQFSATAKTYEYRVLNRTVPTALERHYCWHIRRQLNLDAMTQCLDVVRGEHDFAAFMATGSAVKSTVRTITEADIRRPSRDLFVLRFTANGFLRHMVRNLVGTLVDVGRGKLSRNDLLLILESRDRRNAGMTAPACGLFLHQVHYPAAPGRFVVGGP